jgi:WD40 repeat protein
LIRYVLVILATLCACLHSLQAQDKPEIFPQLGHSKGVNSLVFSLDDRTLISGSADDTIRLWDVASRRERRTLNGHADSVNSIALSPDGRVLASGASKIKLWDLVTGRELQTLAGNSQTTNAVAFSPDGHMLATGNDDGTLTLWDIASGRELKTLRQRGEETFLGVTSVAFSADGRMLASGSDGQTVVLWDVSSGRAIRTLKLIDAVNSVAFSPDGRILAVASTDIQLWDVASGRVLRTLLEQVDQVNLVVFSPDGRILASGSSGDKVVKLWDVGSGRLLRTLSGHSDQVLAVSFSRDGFLLASGSLDNAIKLWEIATGKDLGTLRGDAEPAKSVAFSPDGNMLAAGRDDGTVDLWDAANAHMLGVLSAQSDVVSVAFAPDGRVLASGSSDGTIKLWDVNARRVLHTFADETGLKFAIFSPDGRTLASAGGLLDNTIKLWDVASGRTLRTLKQTKTANSAAFSPDGRILASASDDALMLWDVASGRSLRTLKRRADNFGFYSVAFSPDGLVLASGGDDDSVMLWDVASGRLLHTLREPINDRLYSYVAFSLDGRILASGSSDQSITLWEVATGKEVGAPTIHSEVHSIAFSPGARRLASADDDGTIRIWDTSNDAERVSLVAFTDRSFLVVTPEGYYDASSAKAEEKLNVRVGNRVFPIAAYRDTFYRPDLVKLSLAGNSLTKLGFANIDSVKVAPVVELVDLPLSTSEPKLATNVRLTDGGGGIGRVVLFHNGTAVQDIAGTGSSSQPGASITQSFNLDLVDGPNVLQVEAYNAANTMHSDSVIATVAANLPPRNRSSLHAVVVGIQEFKNPNFNLAYPVKDAQLFADTLSKYSGKLFQNIDIKLLITPADTTRDSLIKVLKDIQGEVEPDDLFVFYVASHGVADDAEFYLITSNVGSVSTEHLKADAVSKEELTALVANIHATKKLMVIDTCHAEALGNALQVGLLTRGLDEATALKVLSRAVGTTVLAASTTTQQALEGYEDHGLFTYVVAQGLMGKGDVDQNGIVNTLGLAHYVDANVPELAQQHFNHPQYPTVETNGQAFPLTKVR